MRQQRPNNTLAKYLGISVYPFDPTQTKQSALRGHFGDRARRESGHALIFFSKVAAISRRPAFSMAIMRDLSMPPIVAA
jgi:hypothetical protein